MTQITNILSIIALLMGVLALVGVGIIMRNIKDKPTYFVTGMSVQKIQKNGSFENDADWANQYIDYHGADKLGGTCNDDEDGAVMNWSYCISCKLNKGLSALNGCNPCGQTACTNTPNITYSTGTYSDKTKKEQANK